MILIGSLIVFLGVFWLLSNLGLISAEFWSIFWPTLIILLGLKMVLIPLKWHRFWSKFKGGKGIKVE